MFKTVFAFRGIPSGAFFSAINFRDPTFFSQGQNFSRQEIFNKYITDGDKDFKFFAPSERLPDCDKLAALSQAALANYSLPTHAVTSEVCLETNPMNKLGDVAVSIIFAKCVACHTGNNPMGPPIPFNDRKKLNDTFNSSPELRQRIRDLTSPDIPDGQLKMPYVGHLEEYERDAILDYLKSSH